MNEYTAEILQAAQNRLRGYPVAEIEVWMRNCRSRKLRPRVRSANLSLFLALETLAAFKAEDWHTFYCGGQELLQCTARDARRAAWSDLMTGDPPI